MLLVQRYHQVFAQTVTLNNTCLDQVYPEEEKEKEEEEEEEEVMQ